MDEILTITAYLTIWILVYHFVIIPRTAAAAFETWRERLESEEKLIVDITAPVVDEIDDLLDQRFSAFFGAISQLGQRAEKMNPANEMKKAIKSGDLYSVLAEYIANKAGIGDITGLLQTQTGQKQPKQGDGLGPL